MPQADAPLNLLSEMMPNSKHPKNELGNICFRGTICNNYNIRLPTFHLPLIKHVFAEQRLDYQLIKMLNALWVNDF